MMMMIMVMVMVMRTARLVTNCRGLFWVFDLLKWKRGEVRVKESSLLSYQPARSATESWLPAGSAVVCVCLRLCMDVLSAVSHRGRHEV